MHTRHERLFASAITIVAGIVLMSAADAGQSSSDLYVKQATWTQTMLATRANLAKQQDAVNGGPAGAESKPFITDAVSGTGPGQQVTVNVSGRKWLRLMGILEQGGGNCHIWGEARLIAKDGSETRLSSLKPVSISVGWGELLRDKNWQNHPLKIGSKEFKHGIWVHSNSDVCYALDGKYERFEAWVGADADRATGVSRFKVLFDSADVLPAIWKCMATDFPTQAKWLDKDSGRGRETQWFTDTKGTQQTEALINRALGELGANGQELRMQYDELRRAKTPGDDPRWLDVYATACRYRDVVSSLGQVWLTELRQAFEKEAAALLQISPDDARWTELTSRAAKVAAAPSPGRACDTAALREAVACLSKALPGRYMDGAELLARLEQQSHRWQQLVPGLVKGDDEALKQLAASVDEMKTLRRDVLSGLRGMREFLAANPEMDKEWESQFASLQHDMGNRGHFAKVAAETFRPDALIVEADRDPVDVVLRRTAALLGDLQKMSAAKLGGLEKEFAELQAANAALDVKNAEARFALFADACRVRRQIAFANPLLDFSEVLFIKRHRALFNHMCDQYYGMAATPGGGLYVLADAFSGQPKVRDVLADATVQNGRLKGQKLSGGPSKPPALRYDGEGNVHGPEAQGGSFLSPDLSYDGKSALFAYVECKGDSKHRRHVDPKQGHWAEERCYHVFKVGVDGSNLTMLTDGTWNDFDPCFLPNGRIAFMSERRGGYLRCGRTCPTYTLYDMAGDGSDINCLSFHETNEWHPSVTHDGRILYTRWDYVDRHGCTAHHPWITTLDGRDSRAVHGNFSPRPVRPDMETDCRAIPGSYKFIAMASPHHGQSYGSIIIIDPHVPDDDAMGPVRRVTPEVGFPETQGGAQVYGTPWPLSEDYYLCVYDTRMQFNPGGQGQAYTPGNYGIYLVDAFGNKELLFRDMEIACLAPIPLKARPMPPVVPDFAGRGPETNPATRTGTPGGKDAEATILVVNVYDSLMPWPEGTKIKELRVLQVLPMSVPSGAPPHDTALRVATAGDSVVPVRYVLGTVPVEDDGSAHLTVPANKEMFFQAVDEKGLAVQSMRSATYLHEGERLVCQGCHEPKPTAPPVKTAAGKLSSGATVMAARRPPSKLKPDVDGSNPFSYPRLVQPVLDAKCVGCHEKNKDKAPNLAKDPIQRNWYASYNSLVQKFGFHDYGSSVRTTPGRFGARASKLYEHLRKGHHDVKLTDEEWHRITLWLDCTSMFYGVYEREGGQAQLRGEVARPTLE
jgi:hypothetical protein